MSDNKKNRSRFPTPSAEEECSVPQPEPAPTPTTPIGEPQRSDRADVDLPLVSALQRLPAWVQGMVILIQIVQTFVLALTGAAMWEQFKLQRETVEQSRPVDFRVDDDQSHGDNLRIRLINSGTAQVVNVSAVFRYYFIMPNGDVKSVPAIEDMLRKNGTMLKAVRAENLLVNPADLHYLFEPSRKFVIKYLDGKKHPDDEEAFEPELSQSTILNAIRLARVLKGKIVFVCRIEYQHHASRQRFKSNKYILLDVKPDISESRPQVDAFDLAELIGGKAIIDKINRHEYSSLEVIFQKSGWSAAGSAAEPDR